MLQQNPIKVFSNILTYSFDEILQCNSIFYASVLRYSSPGHMKVPIEVKNNINCLLSVTLEWYLQ